MTLLQPLIVAVFAVHIAAGFVALGSGVAAVSASKGGPLHRRAGNIFFAAIIVMAAFAAILAVVRPGQIVNLFIAAFASYLVATSWLTVRRPEGQVGLAEKAALAVSALLCAPFALVIFQALTGVHLFKTAFAIEGAILIALVSFTAIIGLAALGDAKVVFSHGICGRPRIARHLWRMCVGLTLATGSAFTNGFARLLPGQYHVPVAFFLPQLIPLVLLAYWMVRVRLTGWRGAAVALP